jgi:FkbM family methyltransferase
MNLDPEQKRIWTENNLEYLRYEYNLNEKSIVYDIGACEGTFLKEIDRLYHCNIFAYEALSMYYNKIKRLKSDKVHIYNYIVSNNWGIGFIGIESESTINDDRFTERTECCDINDIIIDTGIDLMKINIEGGEYDLLDAITEDNLKRIHNIQVQFHILDSTSYQRRLNIHKKLSKTHHLTYEYSFCWENWRKNEL